MFKYFKWLALLVLVAPIFAKDAKLSQTKVLVDYLQSQHVKIVMNGQSFSMFIPVFRFIWVFRVIPNVYSVYSGFSVYLGFSGYSMDK